MKPIVMKRIAFAAMLAVLCTCVPVGAAFADTWTLKHDDARDGDTEYVCVHNGTGLYVMPGDAVTFDVFKSESNIGHETTVTVVGFMPKEGVEGLPEGVELDAEKTAECTTKKPPAEDVINTMPYHTTLKNNSKYGLAISCEGGYDTISGAEYDDRGVMLSEDVKKTVGIKVTPYPVELSQTITVSAPTNAKKTFNASALKTASKSFTIKASAKTKVKYAVSKYPAGGKKFIALSKKSGKSTRVTLKQGAKKGTYKVKLTAPKNATYKAAKACYVTIKVK